MKCFASSYIPPINIRVKTIRNQRITHQNLSQQKGYAYVMNHRITPIEQAIKNAQEICNGNDKKACATAWDLVEELSAAAANKKQNKQSSNDIEESFYDLEPSIEDSTLYDV